MSRNEYQIPPQRATERHHMSDEHTPDETPKVEVAPPVTVKALAIRIAEAKDEDPADTAKSLRRRIRANFDSLAEEWGGLDEAKENRDGNRYPAMPATLADKLFAAMVPATAVEDDEDDTDEDEDTPSED